MIQDPHGPRMRTPKPFNLVMCVIIAIIGGVLIANKQGEVGIILIVLGGLCFFLVLFLQKR